MLNIYYTYERIKKVVLLLLLNLFFLFCGILIKAFPFEPKRKTLIQSRCMRWWARAACSLLGVHSTSTGAYRLSDTYFVVSNHCSYIDILVIGSIIPSVFVSKSEVASWAFLGRMVRLAGTVFVKRESKTASVKAVEAITERLREGINVVVFPEGTTNNGITLKDFKSAFFKAPIDSGKPVLPLSIMYTHINRIPVNSHTIDTVAWHSDMEFLPHFWNLLGTRRIDVHLHFNPPLYGFTNDRKALSSFVFEKIKEGYENQSFVVSMSKK